MWYLHALAEGQDIATPWDSTTAGTVTWRARRPPPARGRRQPRGHTAPAGARGEASNRPPSRARAAVPIPPTDGGRGLEADAPCSHPRPAPCPAGIRSRGAAGLRVAPVERGGSGPPPPSLATDAVGIEPGTPSSWDPGRPVTGARLDQSRWQPHVRRQRTSALYTSASSITD